LKEALGYVPRQITVANNETGETWSYVAERENGWLIASVEHFSSNSVTWSGEVNISASPASDGSSYSYEIADLDAASDPSINLMGVTTSEWDNVSGSGVGVDHTASVSVGGNAPPTGPSVNNEATLEITSNAVDYTHNPLLANDASGGTYSYQMVGDESTDNAIGSGVRFDAPQSGPVKSLTVDILETSGSDYGASVDIYIVQEKPDSTFNEGTLVKSDWNPDWQTGEQSITLDSSYKVEEGKSYTVEFVTTNSDGDGTEDGLHLNTAFDSYGSPWFNYGGTETEKPADMTVHVESKVENLSVQTDEGQSENIGTLAAGETKTIELPATLDTTTLNFSGSGSAGFNYTWHLKEHTQSNNVAVELNGEVYQHQGTLGDGETVQLSADESDLVDGTNRVNVSVGDGSLSADAPDPVVGFTYTHNASDSQSVDYVGGTWIERYNVTKKYSSDRQSPKLTIPFTKEMAKLQRAEYRINGGPWQTASYTWTSGTTLVVEMPNVEAGDSVTVVANGSTVSSNGEVQVLEPTSPGERLDSKIQVTDLPNSGDFYVDVGGTTEGDRVHYLYSQSWSPTDGHSIIEADGTNKIVAPNVAADGTARVTTWPVEVEPGSGAVMVNSINGTRSEPGVSVGPYVDGTTTVQYTFVNAEDGTKYNLYSQKGVVRDSGTASSPLTLEDDDSDETLVFLKENTSGESSESGDSDDPVQQVGQFAKQQSSGFSTFDMLGVVGLGLVGIVGAVVVVRRRRDDGVGSSSVAGGAATVAGGIASGLGTVLEQIVGLLRWFVTHPKMTGALLLLAGIAAVLTGAVSLPPGTGVLIIAVGVPLLTYFAMRKLDRFNPLVFGTVSVGAILLALQLLGGNLVESFLNALGPGALILALAALYVVYRAIRAYQSAASAPEEVNQINIGDDGND